MHSMTAGLALCLLLAPPLMTTQTTLDSTEQQIAAAVDHNNDPALALLERVVNINSGTMNFEGVRQVGDIFKAEFDALGFTTRWIDGAPFKRAGHLIAEHAGSGPRILLIGHLDTVFERDSPFQKFERITPTTAKGPGIIDMKGGDVIIIYAMKALKDAGLLDRLNVVVVMTGDEEDSGDPLELARKPLRDAAAGAGIALGFEDGSADPRRAVTARRGVSGWELRVKGTPAHSSQIFREEVGAGAIYEMARILDGFRQKLSGEALLTLNPGVQLGGTSVDFDSVQLRGTASGKTNVVAEHAVASGDLRTISREQLEKARATMKAIVAAHLPKTSAEITFSDGYPGMAPTEGNTKLLQMYDRASRDLGFGPVEATDPRSAGAADISFVASDMKMALDGIGLMGHDDHTAGETADLATLPSQTKRAAVLIHRLTQSK